MFSSPAIEPKSTVKFLYQDHLWDCPKVVLKTTFGQSQRWSLIRGTLGVENEEKNLAKVFMKIFFKWCQFKALTSIISC